MDWRILFIEHQRGIEAEIASHPFAEVFLHPYLVAAARLPHGIIPDGGAFLANRHGVDDFGETGL